VIETEGLYYPGPGDLGVDEGTRARLASLLLDESVVLPASSRDNRLNYRQWSTEDTIAYGRWLSALVEPETGGSHAPSQKMITRASKLDLGPSQCVIIGNEAIGSISEFQRLIGTVPNRPFGEWTKEDYRSKGKEIAYRHGGRPGREVFNQLSRQGVFPGNVAIIKRFGTISNFYEQIGYPNARGWTEADYLDWGVAVFIQNPELKLTAAAITQLSKRGVGPSERSIREYFGGIIPFREAVLTDYEYRIESQERDKRELIDRMKTAVEKDEVPTSLFDELPEDQHGRAYALYVLAQKFMGNSRPADLKAIAVMNSSDNAARSIARQSNSSVGRVEITAQEMGLYDIIWPMYRFQNVDLSLET
jgi:hypothetical protein